MSLSIELREGTAVDHRRAERSGIVRDMLENTVTREDYQLYLRNLYEVYEVLEQCLRSTAALWTQFAIPKLVRAPSIENDLLILAGDDWRTKLAVLDSATAYRRRIKTTLHEEGGDGLVAHAYVRYLGDLSGGQQLARRLTRHPGLTRQQLSYYRFDKTLDPQVAKREFRHALDAFGSSITDQQRIVCEAKRAFEHNINLSCAVKTHAEKTRYPVGPE